MTAVRDKKDGIERSEGQREREEGERFNEEIEMLTEHNAALRTELESLLSVPTEGVAA